MCKKEDYQKKAIIIHNPQSVQYYLCVGFQLVFHFPCRFQLTMRVRVCVCTVYLGRGGGAQRGVGGACRRGLRNLRQIIFAASAVDFHVDFTNSFEFLMVVGGRVLPRSQFFSCGFPPSIVVGVWGLMEVEVGGLWGVRVGIVYVASSSLVGFFHLLWWEDGG